MRSAERRQTETLQPNLFDRLLDDTPALDRARSRLQELRAARERLEAGAQGTQLEEYDRRIADAQLLVRELAERVGRVTFTEQQLKASVLRDLTWLLGTTNLESVTDLEGHPEVLSSVVNYGQRCLTGRFGARFTADELETTVREAIGRFEPRIDAEDLVIEVDEADDNMEGSALRISIHGHVWAQPLPLEIHLRSKLDLETGTVHIESADGAR